MLAAAFSAASLRADPPAPDPWFTEHTQAGAAAANSITPPAANLAAENPRKVFRQLIEEYETTPEGALTRRLNLLDQALLVSPSLGQSWLATRDALREQRLAIARELERAGRPETDLVPAIRRLGAHHRFLLGDETLQQDLRASPVAERFHQEVRRATREGNRDRLASLQGAIEASGLGSLLGASLRDTQRDTLAALVERKWQASAPSHALLPGEAYLFRHLIRAPRNPLRVRVVVPDGSDVSLTQRIVENLQLAWRDEVELVPTGSAAPADLTLSLELPPSAIECRETRVPVPSEQRGNLREVANPTFVALLKEYQARKQRYEDQLAQYEIDRAMYLDPTRLQEYQDTRQQARDTQAQLDAFLAGGAGAGAAANPDAGSVSEHQRLYNAAIVAKNEVIRMAYDRDSAPKEPEPTHLALLEELENTPSTLVTVGESTPYTYTQTTLDYTFSGSARLRLWSPSEDELATGNTLELTYTRQWTRNEGVRPNDAKARPETFSEAELESAQQSFQLQLSAQCAGQFELLLNQARSAPLTHPVQTSADIEASLLQLTLQVQQDERPSDGFTLAELEELAELARDPELSPREFRFACLSRILARQPRIPAPDADRLSTLLVPLSP